MCEIDKKRVLDKIRVIENSLSKLKTLSHLPLDEFISDFRYFDSAKIQSSNYYRGYDRHSFISSISHLLISGLMSAY